MVNKKWNIQPKGYLSALRRIMRKTVKNDRWGIAGRIRGGWHELWIELIDVSSWITTILQ